MAYDDTDNYGRPFLSADVHRTNIAVFTRELEQAQSRGDNDAAMRASAQISRSQAALEACLWRARNN